MKRADTVRVVILVVIGAIVAVSVIFFPIREYLSRVLELVNHIGIWGPVLVIVFYVVACLLFIPGSLVTLGVGFLFGGLFGAR